VNACAAVEQGREYALDRRCATEALTGSNGPGRDPPAVAVVVVAPDIDPFEPIAPIVAVVPVMPVTPVIPAEAGVPVLFFPWVVA
jgi:hypothetical protein